MKESQLHNYQFDGIKIRTLIRHKNDIKWKNLTPHPTIRNNFCIKPELHPFAKNFRLYRQSDGRAVINLSIPYFLEGHNYLSTPHNLLKHFKEIFNQLIGVDFNDCSVLEYEFGAYEHVEIDSKKFIGNIVGVSNLDLEKSNTHMKMFGNTSKGIHYKIYDAVANAKRKKTFTRGRFPSACLIKHELKIIKKNRLYAGQLFNGGFMEDTKEVDSLKTELLNQYRDDLVFKEQVSVKPIGTDLINIIFTCLKSIEHKLDNTIPNLINDIIESSDLSASQRSKRRKSVLKLDKTYNQYIKR